MVIISSSSSPFANMFFFMGVQDENRYNAGRGAHLTLKRAEKARALVNKLPGTDCIDRKPPLYNNFRPSDICNCHRISWVFEVQFNLELMIYSLLLVNIILSLSPVIICT